MSLGIQSDREATESRDTSHETKSLSTLTEKKITIKVQSWIVNYFHNRTVGNHHCTFRTPLTWWYLWYNTHCTLAGWRAPFPEKGLKESVPTVPTVPLSRCWLPARNRANWASLYPSPPSHPTLLTVSRHPLPLLHPRSCAPATPRLLGEGLLLQAILFARMLAGVGPDASLSGKSSPRPSFLCLMSSTYERNVGDLSS